MATNTYAYKVRDTTGRFREGKVRAGSENAVAEKLLGMGYVPLEVRRTGTGLQKGIKLRVERHCKGTVNYATFTRIIIITDYILIINKNSLQK